MRYTVRHVTRFSYETPITESVMEARMQPRSDEFQRCLHFALATTPPARVMTYQDHDGNAVHHFDIPVRHSRLTVTAEALVDSRAPDPPPPAAAAMERWDELDDLAESGDWFEYLTPSTFTAPTALLDVFAREIGLDRREGPLAVLTRMLGEIRSRFEYRPDSTRVDSPIDEALAARCGVCQDFSHIFIALARQLGVPTRYVSGYLFHDTDSDVRSSDSATHSWVESYIPGHGWLGLDPTNNALAGEGHIRVAIGRDYADVPPTRGVYKGVSAVRTELAVAVRVGPAISLSDVIPFTPWMSRDAATPLPDTEDQQQQQQQ